MVEHVIPLIDSFACWREAARNCLGRGIAPADVTWLEEGHLSLFADEQRDSLQDTAPDKSFKVPAAFLDMARLAICHRDPARFGRLYGVLWRLQAEPRLLQDESDPAVAALRNMCKAVSRDSHKMKAFVRFRETEPQPGEARRRFVAWFEPDHHIVELTAPFFARRFADMDWLIATPSLSACFEAGNLTIVPGTVRPADPADGTVALWQTYYSSIFNPARLKLKAMTSEMPKKYWKNLPEADLIPGLIADAAARVSRMVDSAPTSPQRRIPPMPVMTASTPSEELTDLASVRAEALACRRCDLHRMATQTVFGEGPETARLMLLGEQPGDKEDLANRPFVGPAGQLLDRAMAAAGIPRAECYLTNAVKHFKYEPRGKFRLHKSPDRSEVEHCKWWLGKEIALVKPSLIVALGATAALSLTGRGDGILRRRGQVEQVAGRPPVLITIHPSSILRQRGQEEVDRAYDDLVADLKLAREFAGQFSIAEAS